MTHPFGFSASHIHGIKRRFEMSAHKYTERELKFTAVIYASRSEIVEYIRKNGKLPARVPLGGFPTAMNLFAVKHGTEVELSEEAGLVFDAILKERRLPAEV
jgi:hypothetical protein